MGVAEYKSPSFGVEKSSELATQFDKSISLVKAYTSRFERDFARPAIKTSGVFFERRPISAVFLGFFLSLSFLPVISFIGISVFTVVSFLTVAFGAALVSAFLVILGCFAVLASVLLAALFTSGFLTAGTVFTFLFARFAVSVRRSGVSGISEWANETKSRLVATSKLVDGENQIPSDSASNESIVIVHEPTRTEPEDDDVVPQDKQSAGEETKKPET
ncbi:hypothetical protein NLJ89_g1853 [Agrocybe chaxingu]|uniref:Uncharacterized protein n=1 Tax=Agrocybe chaxingu TaxID=84603 RepID=A0A9W8TCR6_9AGAR|nr:hypothetical protein NLJ89_g1853 [Agrocybe chaxingu]